MLFGFITVVTLIFELKVLVRKLYPQSPALKMTFRSRISKVIVRQTDAYRNVQYVATWVVKKL